MLPKHVFFFEYPLNPFLRKAAEAAFRNLGNKYEKEKRKIMTPKTSGSGTRDIQVQISGLYSFLFLLDQYIQPRDTLHNMDQE